MSAQRDIRNDAFRFPAVSRAGLDRRAGQVDALYLFLCVVTGARLAADLPRHLLLRDQVPPPSRQRAGAGAGAAGRSSRAAWIVIPLHHLHRHLRLGRVALLPHAARAPTTPSRSTPPASSGCGSSSIPPASARSTRCTSRSAAPVKITMASEDVIHSLWFPAFRVKADVLPNRYRTLWFQATKTGRFHIFCAEYCGTLALRDDRLGRGDGADRLPALAGRRHRRLAGVAGREALPEIRLQHLPHWTTPPAAGRCWPARTARRVTLADGSDRRRRRQLHPRVDPQSAGEDRRRLPARSCRRSRGR